MKFIADAMLGKLAKRLRLLGFDVLYDCTLDDNEILRQALDQERMILTRDSGFVQRPLAQRHLFVISGHVQEQLQQVLAAFPDQAPLHFSRCSECNTVLDWIDKREALDRVPQYVYEQHEDFMQCSTCERIYWKGTHTRRILRFNMNKPVPCSGTGRSCENIDQMK